MSNELKAIAATHSIRAMVLFGRNLSKKDVGGR
jgi:hypothetical protein